MPLNLIQLTQGLYFAVLLLLPFGRLAELPVLILAAIGLWALCQADRQWLKTSNMKVYHASYVLYFVMMAVASIDSYWPDKSWLVTLSSFRFYLAGLALIYILKTKHLVQMQSWLLLWVMFLVVDALIQQGLGYDLFGIESYPGRLSGVFGMNVKLGPVLALLLPFVLMALKNKSQAFRWLLVAAVVLVIVLSGTRSAWLMAAFVMAVYWWNHVKGRRWLLLIKVASLSIVAALMLWQWSPDFKERVDRTVAVFQGDSQGLDFALADRLPIWQAAVNMFQAHPINGVGPRAFRKAHELHAGEGDVWLAKDTQGLHAHHWLLEVLSETGLIGLLCFFTLLVMCLKMMWQQRAHVLTWPASTALCAAFLPVVSMYSLFSSFWSLCLWWVLVYLFVAVKND